MKIVSGSSNQELAGVISKKLGITLSEVNINRFSDGELNVEVSSEIRGHDLCIIQSLSFPVNENLMELMLLIDAAYRLNVASITLIIPYLGYARQDRIMKNNNMSSALSSKVIANLLQSHVNEIITVDLHSKQLEGFFDIPVVNLSCFQLFAEYISKLIGNIDKYYKEKWLVVAPDVGSVVRARAFSKILKEYLGDDLIENVVIVDKHREKAGVSEVMNIIGNVKEHSCIIIDDLVDSGGTLCNAAQALKNEGAKSVMCCITHGVLSGNAIDKIEKSHIDLLVTTDTIAHGNKIINSNKIEVVSISNTIIQIIQKLVEESFVG